MTVWFFPFFFLPLSLTAAGNDLTVSAQVDKTEVATNQPLLFSVTIAGTLQEPPKVQLTSFEGFRIVATAQSQQIRIERGQTQEALILTYTLAPAAPGSHTLGPVKVEYQGRVYETQPIEVKVVGQHAVPKQREEPKLEGGVIL